MVVPPSFTIDTDFCWADAVKIIALNALAVNTIFFMVGFIWVFDLMGFGRTRRGVSLQVSFQFDI